MGCYTYIYTVSQLLFHASVSVTVIFNNYECECEYLKILRICIRADPYVSLEVQIWLARVEPLTHP